MLVLTGIISCHEETLCDTAGYDPPEMSLTEPAGQEIEVVMDTELDFTFTMSAEAGLNTFSMKQSGPDNYSDWVEPIWLFTKGETEATIAFKRYFWESGELEFVLHDLCNQSTSLSVKLVVIQPPK